MRLRPFALSIGLLSISGCSFFFTNGPPPGHQWMPYFECGSSRLPLGYDLFQVVGLAGMLGAVGS